MHGLTVCTCEHLESPFSRETVPPPPTSTPGSESQVDTPRFPRGAPSRFTHSRCLRGTEESRSCRLGCGSFCDAAVVTALPSAQP